MRNTVYCLYYLLQTIRYQDRLWTHVAKERSFYDRAGMFVLLPVDVATHNLPSERGATTQDEDDSLGGFVGVTSSTLLVVWTPLYPLQAILHTQHRQIQTGPF